MSNSKYDSDFCGSLPIHLINLIQPYGVLIVLDRQSFDVMQVSENADKVFGVSLQKLTRSNLKEYLPAEQLRVLSERSTEEVRDKIPALWDINGKSYLTLIHPKDNLLLAEIDLTEYNEQVQKSFVKVYQEIKFAMSLIQSTSNVSDVARLTARELKRISGFDKVMVYRFDKDWNGTVIGEEKEDDMEAYNGFTFPASDIPQPARLLYLKNPYRFIPSREYTAVKLFPVINPSTNTFLDLSDCNVRAVAAVHIEYLKNMNVIASMSTRILVGDRLWGLIACHHRSAMNMSFEMRSIFEMISNIVSAKISNLSNSEMHESDSKLREDYKDVIETAYRQGNLHEALLNGSQDVLKLFGAQGVIISRRGKLLRKGDTPADEEAKEFILWLHTRDLKSIFYSDSLSEVYEPATTFKGVGSGVLVIPIDPQEDEYVLIFRPEVLRVINWGGNPNERIHFVDDKNYHPRNSFRQWQQNVQGTSMPWREQELVAAENLRSFIFEFNN